MMKIDVSELRKEKGCVEDFSGLIPSLTVELLGTETNFQDIRIKGTASNTGSGIFVKGNAAACSEFTCGLCLRPFSSVLQVPFEETFFWKSEDDPETEEGLGRCYEGDEIDLGEVILESLILALPMKPLCSPDCLGLCPVCGCDRNTEQCSCDPHVKDPRLAVLKGYFEKLHKTEN